MVEQLYQTPASFSIGKQLSFPDLTAHLSTTRVSVGFAGELLASRALQANGYHVRLSHERGDLSVILPSTGEVVAVEVKTARYGKDGTYRFTLYKHWQGRQCADHRNADIVILLCVSRTGHAIPFVVPVPIVGDRRVVAITSRFPTKYAGWLTPFRQTLGSLRLPPPQKKFKEYLS